MIDKLIIEDFPNASAFIVKLETTSEGSFSVKNVGTFNYGYGVAKDLIHFHAKQFKEAVQLQLTQKTQEHESR